MKKLISSLENNFFQKSFQAIKDHPKFQKINLTDEEIISNRQKIKQVLACNCDHENSEFCKNFLDHLSVCRKPDNKLQFTTYTCKKNKAYWAIDNETLNQQINKLLICSDWGFDNQEALESIKKIMSLPDSHAWITKMAKSSLDNTLKQKNFYITSTEHKKTISTVFAYSSIINNEFVSIIRAQTLKEIILNYCLSFSKITNDQEDKYLKILNVSRLIVVNLGNENEINTIDYYLDYLQEFLFKKYSKKKSIIFISSLAWGSIKKSITENIKFTKNHQVKKNKLETLEKLLFEIFNTI